MYVSFQQILLPLRLKIKNVGYYCIWVFPWVPGTKVRLSGLGDKCFYPLSHLPVPILSLACVCMIWICEYEHMN